jgi:hypothetical protein
MLTIGIDTHKATLAVSAIDVTGRERGARTFPNDHPGHVKLLHWAQALGGLGFVRCGLGAPPRGRG